LKTDHARKFLGFDFFAVEILLLAFRAGFFLAAVISSFFCWVRDLTGLMWHAHPARDSRAGRP
jgi:hypothetical protein